MNQNSELQVTSESSINLRDTDIDHNIPSRDTTSQTSEGLVKSRTNQRINTDNAQINQENDNSQNTKK